MQRIPRRLSVTSLAFAASVLLAACSQHPAATSNPKPAALEKIAGSNVSKVILTEQGAKRIDLRTEPIRVQDGGPTMPYAAIVYDKVGDTWVYTAAEPLTFVRQSISVGAIKGDVALLKDGPAPGTQVVTVGVAELYGVEFGAGH
jgi:hypothetical protein